MEGGLQPIAAASKTSDLRRLALPRLARPALNSERACRAVLWVAMAVYAAWMSRVVFDTFERMESGGGGFDLGIFDQATWLISRGHTPFVTTRGLHILADHFSAILYLLAPLYWLWDSPKVLLTAQTVALALGALPLYAIARHRLQSPLLGLAFGVVYLLHPVVQNAGAAEFHPDTFATPLLLAAFWFWTQKKWLPYFAALVLMAGTKEIAGFAIALLGVYICCFDRRIGALTIALGIVSIVVALVTVRFFNGGAPSAYFWLYGQYGHDLPSVVAYILGHPLEIWHDLNQPEKRHYLFALLQPLLFLPLLAPEILLLTVPLLLANVLSRRDAMYHADTGYYSALLLPFLLVASVVAFERLQRRGDFVRQAVGVNLVLWAAFAFSGGILWRGRAVWSPSLSPARVQQNERLEETRALIAQIPASAAVSANTAIVPLMAHRRAIYNFPNPFVRRGWGNTMQARRDLEVSKNNHRAPPGWKAAVNKAPVEYVVLCPYVLPFFLGRAAFNQATIELLKSPRYGIVAVGQSTLMLRRGADHRHGLRLLAAQADTTIREARHIAPAYLRWTANQPTPG